MELSKTGTGQTAYITNVSVFSATSIVDGALLCTGATTTALGAVVTTGTTTAASADYLGVTQLGTARALSCVENNAPNSHAFSIPTSGFPNTGSTTTANLNYLPLCINTDAMYLALYSTTTGSGTASDTIGTWTASTTTLVSRGSTGVDMLGGWLFSLTAVSPSGATPTFGGSLRFISNQSSTTDMVMLTAMNVSTDSHMLWIDRTWKKSGVMNTTADAIRSGGAGTAIKLVAARQLAIENWVSHDQAPMHPLRKHIDNGLDILTGARFYGEVIFTSPLLQELA